MNAEKIRAFLEGHSVYALDPVTREVTACIDYGTDGRCLARFTDGRKDAGVYGFEGDTYWTRYDTFRNGERHVFRLDEKSPDTAQAYFADGTIAFLQSYSQTPDVS